MAQREVHCAARDCGALDFLPRVCRHCSHPFCTTHASPPAHACAHDPALARAHGPRKFEGRFQDLVPDREASRADRKASEDKVKEEQQRKAQAGVEAMRARFAAAGVPKRGGTSAAPKRVNPALELIKLKGRAVPGDTRKSAANVPMDERVFLVAKCSDGEHDKGTQELWFHKDVSIGRVLDLLAERFKVTNENNRTDTQLEPLRLVKDSARAVALETSSTLGASVDSGETVVLTRRA